MCPDLCEVLVPLEGDLLELEAGQSVTPHVVEGEVDLK